jgi:hypothetical protein
MVTAQHSAAEQMWGLQPLTPDKQASSHHVNAHSNNVAVATAAGQYSCYITYVSACMGDAVLE